MVSRVSDRGGDTYWGRMTVTVEESQPASDLVLSLIKAATLSGHMLLDGHESADQLALFAFAEPADGSVDLGLPESHLLGRTGSPNTFHVDGLMPGEYFLRFPLGGPGPIKSVMWQGVDHTYMPFDANGGTDFTDIVVTFTSQKAVLVGTVRDANNRPVSNSAVIVYPVDRRLWSRYGLNPPMIKSVMVSTNGTYQIQSLPEGDYYVIAVDASAVDAWHDSAFFDTARPAASQVTLTWGSQSLRDLTVAHVR
jgi:hypothetical protein